MTAQPGDVNSVMPINAAITPSSKAFQSVNPNAQSRSDYFPSPETQEG
jgi:hypothetical protein